MNTRQRIDKRTDAEREADLRRGASYRAWLIAHGLLRRCPWGAPAFPNAPTFTMESPS